MNKNPKPVVVAMIGLVGSGKTTVAKELAKRIGGIRIDGDDIRLALRKEKKDYSRVREIATSLGLDAIKRGKSVVLSSDFVGPDRQKELRAMCAKAKVRLFFVNVQCDPDVAIARILKGDANQFFDEAKSVYNGKDRGRTIRLREFWRRSPNHYTWFPLNGGEWKPKKLKLSSLFNLDTTDGKKWKVGVAKIAKRLLSR